jgi:hypothetical protein
MPSPQIPRRCFVCTGHAKVQRSATVELRDLFSRSPAFNGAWPGQSQTSYFTTSPCRWATCEATVESMCLSFTAIPIAPTTPIWTSAVFPTPDLWRSATPHARSAPCAITWGRPASIMADRAARPFEYRNHPRLQGLDASAFDASAFVVNRVSFAPGVVVDLARGIG